MILYGAIGLATISGGLSVVGLIKTNPVLAHVSTLLLAVALVVLYGSQIK